MMMLMELDRHDTELLFQALMSAYGLFSPVAYGRMSPALTAGSGSTTEDLG
ncbi:hypothetical protein [Streptomyces sp. NWU49]|uniref:hypothetical protein n=1 Tax=Streptomyces sp. NWU49 TaxID=2201153 RepID=UPI0015E7EE3A|nr:hypothetical protein [Streptomyces sp. NWU49]